MATAVRAEVIVRLDSRQIQLSENIMLDSFREGAYLLRPSTENFVRDAHRCLPYLHARSKERRGRNCPRFRGISTPVRVLGNFKTREEVQVARE